MLENESDIEELEKTIGKIDGAHEEISLLSRKSPNEAVNKFKLKLLNKILGDANVLLGEEYKPFDTFEEFDVEDDVMTTSDVVMVLSQYRKELDRFRGDNVWTQYGTYYYIVDSINTEIRSPAPKKFGK